MGAAGDRYLYDGVLARCETEGRRIHAVRDDEQAIEFAVATALIVHLPVFSGRSLTRGDFERIVDEALLPLLLR